MRICARPPPNSPSPHCDILTRTRLSAPCWRCRFTAGIAKRRARFGSFSLFAIAKNGRLSLLAYAPLDFHSAKVNFVSPISPTVLLGVARMRRQQRRRRVGEVSFLICSLLTKHLFAFAAGPISDARTYLMRPRYVPSYYISSHIRFNSTPRLEVWFSRDNLLRLPMLHIRGKGRQDPSKKKTSQVTLFYVLAPRYMESEIEMVGPLPLKANLRGFCCYLD